MPNMRNFAGAGASAASDVIDLFIKDRLTRGQQDAAQRQQTLRTLLTQGMGMSGEWDKLSPEVQQQMSQSGLVPFQPSSQNSRAAQISGNFSKATNLSELDPEAAVMQQAQASGLGAQDDAFLSMMDAYGQHKANLMHERPTTKVDSQDPSTGASISNNVPNDELSSLGAYTTKLSPQDQNQVDWTAAHAPGGGLNPAAMLERNAALKEKTYQEHQGANASDYGDPTFGKKMELANAGNPGKDQQTQQSAADALIMLMPQLQRMQDLSKKVNVYGPNQVLQRGGTSAMGALGVNPDAKELSDLADSMSMQMANAIGGNKGAQSENDKKAMRQRLVDSFMSGESADRAMESLQKWIFGGFQQINSLPKSMPPEMRVELARQAFGLPPMAPVSTQGTSNPFLDQMFPR